MQPGNWRISMACLLGGMFGAAWLFPSPGMLGEGFPCDHSLEFIVIILGLAGALTFAEILTRPRLWRILLSLCLAALVAQIVAGKIRAVPGLEAVYRYETRPGQWELVYSMDSPRSGISRIDRTLDLAGVAVGLGRSPLWLDFLNETSRDLEPSDRLQHRLEVTWRGVITPGQTGNLAIVSNGQARLVTPSPVTAGVAAPLELTVLFASLENPSLRLAMAENGRVVPGSWLTTTLPGNSLFPALLIWMARLCLLLAILLAVREVVRNWKASGPAWQFMAYAAILIVAVIAGVAMWESKLPQRPYFNILPGNDYLIYETEARHLLLNGFYDSPLPFHRSAGMRYYLALAHWAFGEDGYGIMLWQQVIRGLTAILAGLLWFRLTGKRSWQWVVMLLILFFPQLPSISLHYWPEAMGVCLFALLCLSFVAAEQNPARAMVWFAAAGLWAGLLTLFRPNAIAFVVGIPLWMLLRRRKFQEIALLLLPFLLLNALVPIRNKLVTDQWIWTATQGPINVVLGNNIPKEIKLPPITTGSPQRDQFFYQGLARLLDFDNNPNSHFDVFPEEENYAMQKPLTQVFYAYLRQYPGHFLLQLLKKTQKLFLPIGHGHIFWAVTLAMLASLILLVRERKIVAWGSVLALVFIYAATLLLAYFKDRHRLVIMPEMVVLGSYSLSYLVDRVLAKTHSQKISRCL